MDTTPLGGIFSQSLGVDNIDGSFAKDFTKCVGQIVVPGMILSLTGEQGSSSWSFGSGVVQVPSRPGDEPNTFFALIRKVSIPSVI